MTETKIIQKLFFYVAFILFLLLIPFKCFSQNNISAKEASDLRNAMVVEAKKYVGCPYVRGATGPEKFDCSGLVYYVAQKAAKIQLPRTVKAMYGFVKIVPDSEREKGDLVFFKTTGDGTVSHVGLYIGNNQFISAVSDGPNTGVIVSSLKESYWKRCYYSTGKFIRSGTQTESSSMSNSVNENTQNKTFISNTKKEDKFMASSSVICDWSLFTAKSFMLNFRGISGDVDIFYKGIPLYPGIGLIFRWNYLSNAFQIPIVLSLRVNDYLKFYAGPVITIGKINVPSSEEKAYPSVFPGIVGISWNTPSLTKGNFKVQLFQDLSYSIFNKEDNSALNFINSISAGFLLNTGIRVTFPLF